MTSGDANHGGGDGFGRARFRALASIEEQRAGAPDSPETKI